jgi:hypothetical protein
MQVQYAVKGVCAVGNTAIPPSCINSVRKQRLTGQIVKEAVSYRSLDSRERSDTH